MSLIDSNIKTETAGGGPGIFFRALALFPSVIRLIICRLIDLLLPLCGKRRIQGFESIRNIPNRLLSILPLLFPALAIIIINPVPSVAVPPNTIIDNMAVATYNQGIIEDIELESNIVRVITVIIRTPSTTELLRYAPDNNDVEMIPISTTYYSSSGTPGGQFIAMSPPVAVGQTAPIDLNRPIPLIQSNRLLVGEPAFIRLTDHDQNIDSLTIETVVAQLNIDDNNESELVRLSETNPNSGIFTGYIQTGEQFSAQPNNGYLSASEGYELRADYTDLYDPEDTSSDSLQFILSDRSIYIVKSASKNVVSPGDYLQYKLNVTNVTTPYPSQFHHLANIFLGDGYTACRR